MRVYIDGIWYDAENVPIMVELTPSDKENISNMPERATRYICYPETDDWEDVKKELNIKQTVFVFLEPDREK